MGVQELTALFLDDQTALGRVEVNVTHYRDSIKLLMRCYEELELDLT